MDPPTAAPGTAPLRQVCLLWALCNGRGWARRWERGGCCHGGVRPPERPRGRPQGRGGDGGCRGVLVEGAAGRWRSRKPCPRRVPQPRAGTAGASDSSGGRASCGNGRAREDDEPVQAWAHLVSPLRLRCLIPSCCSAPVLPTLPRNGVSQRAAGRSARPSTGAGRTCRPLSTRAVLLRWFVAENIPDGFWSSAGARR